MSKSSAFRILITGANQRIRLEFVRQYSRMDNTYVFANCCNPESALELPQLAYDVKNIIIIPLVVTDMCSIENAHNMILDYANSLDLLINKACFNVAYEQQNLADVTFDFMPPMFNVNTIAPLMIASFDELKPKHSGGFYNCGGRPHAW